MRTLTAAYLGFLSLIACSPDRTAAPRVDPETALTAVGVPFEKLSYQIIDLGTTSMAFDVNDAGATVGVLISASGAQHAFFKAPGKPRVDLGTLPGGLSSEADGINNRGQVVGRSDVPGGLYHAFLWTAAGGMMDLGTLEGADRSIAMDINDRGEVVGYSVSRCFLWSAQHGMRPLPTLGGDYCSAAAINNRGQVVGTSYTAANVFHAFLWSEKSGITDLGTLPEGDISFGRSINNRGEVVGFDHTAVTRDRAFLWTPTSGMVDLGTPEGFTWAGATGINDHGVIVGVATTSWQYLDSRAFIWTAPGRYHELPLLGAYNSATRINRCGQVAGASGADAYLTNLHAVLWTRGCRKNPSGGRKSQ